MPVMNFDLEDGLPPVSFDLKAQDCVRFVQFMADCDKALKSQQAAAPTPPVESTAPGSWIPVQAAIDDYLSGYECDDGESICHSPTEFEAFLITDAIAGLLNDEKFREEFGKWPGQKTPTPPAQEAEPYAYAYKSSSDPRPSVYFEKMNFFPPSFQEIPLYTNAPSDKLRQAAEEVLNSIHEEFLYSNTLSRRCWAAVDGLRSVLKGKS